MRVAHVCDFAAAQRDGQADLHRSTGGSEGQASEQQVLQREEHPAHRLDQLEDIDDRNLRRAGDDEAQQERDEQTAGIGQAVDCPGQGLQPIGFEADFAWRKLRDVRKRPANPSCCPPSRLK